MRMITSWRVVTALAWVIAATLSPAAFAADDAAQPLAPPAAGAPRASAPDKSLSERLKEDDGVIKPVPGLDAEIKKQPPASVDSNMPVIPPPGEPGGDPNVQPK